MLIYFYNYYLRDYQSSNTTFMSECNIIKMHIFNDTKLVTSTLRYSLPIWYHYFIACDPNCVTCETLAVTCLTCASDEFLETDDTCVGKCNK